MASGLSNHSPEPNHVCAHRTLRRIRNTDGNVIIIIMITSIALKSSGARTQKCNKTKSLLILKSRGHTGVITYLRWKSNFEEIRFKIFTERGKSFTRFQCGWEFIPNDGCIN